MSRTSPMISLCSTNNGERLWPRSKSLTRKLTLPASVLFAGSFVCPALSQPVTSEQIKSLSDAQLRQMVGADIGLLLRPVDKGDWGRLRQFRHLTAPTASHATGRPGLCQRELVQIDYKAADGDRQPENQPLTPYRVEVRAQYRQNGERISDTVRVGAQGTPSGPSCDDVQTAQGWFEANSLEEASSALDLLSGALHQLDEKALKLAACNLSKGTNICGAQQWDRFRKMPLSRIDRQRGQNGEDGFDYYFGSNIKMTIRGRSSPQNSQIVADYVSIGDYVVVD